MLYPTDKETPAKPWTDNEEWSCCPRCNGSFSLFDGLGKKNKYCGNCGQRIDWSGVNQND